MTSKLVVNTIEADTGISSVSFASSISMDSTAKFHFSAAGVDIGADTNINRPAAGVLGFNISGAEKLRIDTNGHLNTSGIVTAANFKSGVTNVHNLGVTLTGGQLDVGSNIKLGNAGVITATSFVGSGANLTGLNSDLVTDTSPQLGGNLDVNAKNIVFGDSSGATDDRLTFGDGTDLSIYHDGFNSRIADGGTGYLINTSNGDGILFQHSSGQNLAKFLTGGAAELYHNYEKKLFTKDNGVQVEDTTATGAYLTMATSSGTAGKLYATGNSTLGFLDSQNHYMLKAVKDGAVELYYDNSVKLKTTGHGIKVEDDNPYIVIQDSDTASGNGVVGWIEAQNSNGYAMWKVGNTHNDQNTLWINNQQNASTKFTGAVSGDTWEIYGNSGHFTPCSDNTFDIGESNRRIRNIYTADLHCSNRGSSNDVDGTWGDFTIQEGESDLFLINNRNGKKYKFNLTEVS